MEEVKRFHSSRRPGPQTEQWAKSGRQLTFADHMSHFDAFERCGSCDKGLEPEPLP
jgi:hypothetical protein